MSIMVVNLSKRGKNFSLNTKNMVVYKILRCRPAQSEDFKRSMDKDFACFSLFGIMIIEKAINIVYKTCSYLFFRRHEDLERNEILRKTH